MQNFVSLETWIMNVQNWGFPRVTNEWTFQDLVATQTIISTQCSLSQENGLKLCLTGGYFKGLSPRRPEQWMCRAKTLPVSLWNCLFRTTWWAVFQETWMNVQRPPCVSDECPLQDNLSRKPIISTWQVLPLRSQETYTNVQNLPFDSGECLLEGHLLSKLITLTNQLCLSGGLNDECAEASPVSQTSSSVFQETWTTVQMLPLFIVMSALYKTIFSECLLY